MEPPDVLSRGILSQLSGLLVIDFLLPKEDIEDIMNAFIYLQKGQCDELEDTQEVNHSTAVSPVMAGDSSPRSLAPPGRKQPQRSGPVPLPSACCPPNLPRHLPPPLLRPSAGLTFPAPPASWFFPLPGGSCQFLQSARLSRKSLLQRTGSI